MNPTPDVQNEDQLNRAMRLVASQAASLAAGGSALVYTHQTGDPTSAKLRAAAAPDLTKAHPTAIMATPDSAEATLAGRATP